MASLQVLFAGDSNLKFVPKSLPATRHHVSVKCVPGARVVDDRKGFCGVLEQHLRQAPPDVLFLHLGSNDASGFSSVESFLRGLGDIVDSVWRVAPRTTVKICAILPRMWNNYDDKWSRKHLERVQWRVAELNRGLRHFCLKRNLDLVEYAVPHYHFGRDGLHVNPVGATCLLSTILGKVDRKHFAPLGGTAPPKQKEFTRSAAAVTMPYPVVDAGVEFGWSDSDSLQQKNTMPYPVVDVAVEFGWSDGLQRKNVKLSQRLAWILRHGAEKEGLTMLSGGFVYLDKLVRRMPCTVQWVHHLVATDAKNRFALGEDEVGRHTIRANQGHSIETNLNPVPVLSVDHPVIHGTTMSAWKQIRLQGLSRMGRNHIHFAAGEPGTPGVVSGIRNSSEVLIYIHARKALEAGLKFYRSQNNVILSPGDKQGTIPSCYFSQVVHRISGGLLNFRISNGKGCEQHGLPAVGLHCPQVPSVQGPVPRPVVRGTPPVPRPVIRGTPPSPPCPPPPPTTVHTVKTAVSLPVWKAQKHPCRTHAIARA